jgi:hypothetical protein
MPETLKGAFIPIGSMTSGFPSRLMRLPAVPHDAAMHSIHPEMGHGLRCPRTMFTKQVSRPVDSLDPPSWHCCVD